MTSALAAVALGVLLAPTPAHADLGADLAAVIAGYEREGVVLHPRPRLYERGGDGAIPLPLAASDTRLPGCTTVAVVGVRSAVFVAGFAPAETPDGDGGSPTASTAGFAVVTRCGAERRGFRRFGLELRSPRAVLEVVVLLSSVAPPALSELLPARDPGPSAPPPRIGGPPAPPPLTDRARAWAERARRRGASAVTQALARADGSGDGALELTLEPGCHELRVGTVPRRPFGLDLDAQVRWASGALAASDRSGAPDASLDLCVVSPQRIGLEFAGATPGGPVLALAARYPLPLGLPARLPEGAQAALAEALFRQRTPNAGEAIAHALGIGGLTGVPWELEPDACYLAALTTVDGKAGNLALSVTLGTRRHELQGGGGTGAVLAFCAQGAPRAILEVQAQGGALAWALVVWQHGRLPLGEVVP